MTGLACVRVGHEALPLLDRLGTLAQDGPAVLGLRDAAGADQLFALVTCERGEVYAAWEGRARPDRLVAALALAAEVPVSQVRLAARVLEGAQVPRHLFRVAAGLESFALGETDIVAQVRATAALARTTATTGTELDRLLDAAVSTSRRVHRLTRLAESSRSTADAAVDAAAARLSAGGELGGHRVLVVGAGRFAAAVVDRAGRLGARVTVCNRTRRHAERFRRSGAEVVGIEQLGRALARCDAAILGTASPVPLVDAGLARTAMRHRTHGLLVLDACIPRNVDPQVRDVAGVTLLDVRDLRAGGGSATWTEDAEAAASVVDAEVDRFCRWWARREASRRVAVTGTA